MQLWKPIDFSGATCRHWQIGPLKIWLQRSEHEWLVAFDRDPLEEEKIVIAEPSEMPADLDINRFVCSTTSTLVTLKPTMADRALVVRTEAPLHYIPGADGVFYAMVPITIRITIGDLQSVTLTDIPTVVLSNTWLGDNTLEGELCYAMRTRARRTLAELPSRPHRAVCALTLNNKSGETLDFERLCIQAPHLTVYWHHDQLWTSQVNVSYRGEQGFSHVNYNDDTFRSNASTKRLSEPHVEASPNLFRRTFAKVKEIANRQI